MSLIMCEGVGQWVWGVGSGEVDVAVGGVWKGNVGVEVVGVGVVR